MARTRRSDVRFPRARPSASGPSLKLPRTSCTGRPMRPGCCDGCCAASLACVRSRRAAVRWMVCAHAKDALPAHAPATVGLDALLPAAGATHGPADELQQRARCPLVTYTRSTSCSRRISRRQRHDAAKRASHYPPRARHRLRDCAVEPFWCVRPPTLEGAGAVTPPSRR
jgi:hypothetical protein